MKLKMFLLAMAVTVFTMLFGQIKRIDTTVKMGAAGYRVYCNNKSAENNTLSIKPTGFESSAQEANFLIKGKIAKVEIEDFNNDGFPDLILYIYSGANGEMGTVIGITSVGNKSMSPIYFPDILDDVKLRVGYKGHDEFYLLQGTLMRSFPIFKTEDAPDKPTGGKRVVQYQMTSTEREGVFKFKVLRSYDAK
jgi:hypothetical protein